MNPIILSLLIGLAAGTLDALPMILKKLPKSATLSAFLQYVVASVIIVNIDLPGVVWWLEGGLISLMMAIPIVIIIAEADKKSVPIILANAVVLGTLIAVAGHYLKYGNEIHYTDKREYRYGTYLLCILRQEMRGRL